MIPIRPSVLKLEYEWPRQIVLHHTSCLFGKNNSSDFRIDNSKFQSQSLNSHTF